MRKNGGLQSPGHDAGGHGGTPARQARGGEGNAGSPRLGSRSQLDDGGVERLAEHWTELLDRRQGDTRARARRSNGGDAETTTHAREREPGVEWRCPRDRGRRGEL
jgi:hypothetical protein